ncbi:MAG: hypothetical protein UR60_C0010G0001 [Candidatus Moranbacteria bacterium GW2011_GWF2_34_56]|nr:MAG: hypothetical protein UR51_C0001G0027 [Candidatus Moranbacteria bacterium GW2011_GWF1_34_10]KKP65012.1 MAG: hypothetical protein UR60_C0010G0001 [Candidatus Moranbacteria bacterium GW2011_GWF2_34_56]
MNIAFIAFYLMFLVGCFVASIFIIYHITRYSINKKSSTIMLALFVSVLLILLLINFSIFTNLDLDKSFNFISNLDIGSSSF